MSFDFGHNPLSMYKCVTPSHQRKVVEYRIVEEVTQAQAIWRNWNWRVIDWYIQSVLQSFMLNGNVREVSKIWITNQLKTDAARRLKQTWCVAAFFTFYLMHTHYCLDPDDSAIKKDSNECFTGPAEIAYLQRLGRSMSNNKQYNREKVRMFARRRADDRCDSGGEEGRRPLDARGFVRRGSCDGGVGWRRWQ